MKRRKAFHRENFLPNQIPTGAQSKGTKNCPNHTSSRGKDISPRAMTPPCQSKRHLLARMRPTGLLPNGSGPLSTLTLARSSLGVISNNTFPLLCYCASAFQFFVATGQEPRKTNPTCNSSTTSRLPGHDWNQRFSTVTLLVML